MKMSRIAWVIVAALFAGACASTAPRSGPVGGAEPVTQTEAVADRSAAVPQHAGPLLFGAPVTLTEPASIDALASDPASFSGRTLLLEGVVKEVCQGRGCWVEVMAPGGASFMARSLDHSILLPKDCKGRRILVQGVLVEMPETKEAHDDHGEKGHECPAPEYVVSTQAVKLAAK